MNIALFTDSYLPEINGVATSTNILYETLKAHGHNVFVVCTNSKSRKIIIEGHIIRMPGIRLKHLYGYILTNFYSKRIAKILKERNIDIIHVQSDLCVGQFGFIFAKLYHITMVYTYHTMYEDYSAYATRGKVDRFAKWSVRQYTLNIAADAHGLISPSKKTMDYLRRIGIKKYISIVPTGINFDKYLKYQLENEKVREYKKEFNIKENDKVFLSLGRLGEEKSVDVIVSNFIYFLQESKRDDVHLVVVGGGPLLETLKKLVEDSATKEHIHFTGPVNPVDTPFYYRTADFFVSASLTETQGLTIIEAMICKKILLTRFDFNLQNLVKDGYNGFFYSTKEDFLKKITKLLQLPATSILEMQTNAFESVQKYSSEAFYEGVMEVYKNAKRRNL